MAKVIYITGAPATGKSTLCNALSADSSSVQAFCYSERLRDYVAQRTGRSIDERGIREQSARTVTSEDVNAVDQLLMQEAKCIRSGVQHLVIDSHPVTKEDFGFRVTPFSGEMLAALHIDALICLYAAPSVLVRRIKDDPQGRPLPTEFELSMHVQLQASVAAQYAVLCGGCPLHLIDSDITKEELVARVKALTHLT